MKRFAWIVCAFSLLALNACGDEDAPACDDERYDCTPLDDGKQPPDDGQNPPDDATPPNPPQWEEGWVPTKEDLAAIGVVFPDELDPKPPSSIDYTDWSEFADELCRDETQTEQTAYNLFNCGFGLPFFGEYNNEYYAPQNLQDQEYYCGFMSRGKHAGPVIHMREPRRDPEDPYSASIRHYAPPTDSFDWACIETPYGAAWLPLDNADDAKNNVVPAKSYSKTNTTILRTTCDKTIPWIVFVKAESVNSRLNKHSMVYAYTVGTEADEFKPVTTCQPWGPNDQSSD